MEKVVHQWEPSEEQVVADTTEQCTSKELAVRDLWSSYAPHNTTPHHTTHATPITQQTDRSNEAASCKHTDGSHERLAQSRSSCQRWQDCPVAMNQTKNQVQRTQLTATGVIHFVCQSQFRLVDETNLRRHGTRERAESQARAPNQH